MLCIIEKARGEAAFWAPYVQFLPETYDDPYWWSPEDLALIAGTRLARAVELYRQHLGQLTLWMRELMGICRCGASCGLHFLQKDI